MGFYLGIVLVVHKDFIDLYNAVSISQATALCCTPWGNLLHYMAPAATFFPQTETKTLAFFSF